MARLTHFDAQGKAAMVDVSAKAETERVATAKGSVIMQPETLALIAAGEMKKGDVLAVARLAGIMALSAYLPLQNRLAAELSPANAATPVFVAHGRLDPVLPFVAGEHARDRLQALGLPVTWKAYQMPHSVCAEEVVDISAFLRGVLLE